MHSIQKRATQQANDVFRNSGCRARLEDGYTRVDPFQIASWAGVTVILRPLDKLLGAFIRQSSSGILINVARSAGLVHMTCAHELGHFFAGHETTADETIDYGKTTNIKEIEAEWFAYQLLAPRLVMAKVMRQKGWSVASLKNPLVLYQLSLRLGISYSAAAWSLNRQNLLDRSTVDQLLRVQPADIKRALVGGELPNPHKEVWLLDEKDRTFVLEPRPEDQLVLRLKSNASAGYIWSPKEAAGEGFQISPIEGQSRHSKPSEDLVIGAPVTLDFFVSQERNEAEVSDTKSHILLEERRPWSKGAPPCASYHATTSFEHLQPGLTRVAKVELFQELKS